MNNLRSNVPTLDGASNYTLWDIQMTVHLKGQGLWNVVAGTEKRNPDPATTPEHEACDKKDAQAISQIFMTLEKDEKENPLKSGI